MITKHTVSLKLAKQMEKLGWKKMTLLARYIYDGSPLSGLVFVQMFPQWWHDKLLPAPIASEILEELPDSIKITRFQKDYRVENDIPNGYAISDLTLVEALGKMWLYLNKEEKKHDKH